MILFSYRPTPARVIDAKQLEELFARGLSMPEVAKELKMSSSFLSRKICNSQSLMEARERGRKIFELSK